MRGDISSNLAILRKINPTTVEGRVLATPGHFIWLRPHLDNPLRGGTDLPQYKSSINGVWRVVRDGTELLCVHARDGAWAEASAADGPHTVTQGGPRRIWDQVEQAVTLWSQLGQPRVGRFGMTVTTDQQRLWLDTPEITVAPIVRRLQR